MIGTGYTPGLLAELAKKPNVRSLEIPVPPKGQRVSSCTKRYTDGWVCKTTLFDVGDVELASVTAEYDEDSTRFGLMLDHEVEKVTTSDVVTSFFEDETSDEPWLVIVEPC